MIRVFHKRTPDFRPSPAFAEIEFDLAAEVDVDSLEGEHEAELAARALPALEGIERLEAAFALTQNGDRSWWENPSVRAARPGRSTSVGDVLELDGRYYTVLAAGFAEIERRESLRATTGE